jgi:hypothetical protein
MRLVCKITVMNPYKLNSGYIHIMTNETLILKKLENLEKEVKEIKTRMVDSDSIMTENDYSALIEYRKEKKSGKLVSHEHTKKELGL